MAQVNGSVQQVEIDVAGGTSYKFLVCLSSSSISTTADANSSTTNCGVLTSVSEPKMKLDFDAVCETAPSVSQVSYASLLTAIANKTLVAVRFQNPPVVGSSYGVAYYHQFLGYITDLQMSQSSTEFIKFTGSITSTGILDVAV